MTARRTAFVTGAAYGIGAASALALAGDGCDVAVSELKPDDLADVLTAFGHLDVLVNNAGVPLTCPAVEVTEAEWNAVIDVNLKGVFFTSQQMGRHLIASGRGGAIVSIASTHGVIGIADRSIYGISKAGDSLVVSPSLRQAGA